MWEGHGLIGGGFMWLIWIVLIVAVVWGISAATGGGGQLQRRDKSALEILEERYARGEIDNKEFEERKRELLR